MTAENLTLTFNRTIHAPAAQVYQALTNSTWLRSWLSDIATTDPRKGGRCYLAWNSGYFTAGEFVTLEPGKQVTFTWQGRAEPGQTRVEIALAGQGEETSLSLSHTGLGAGEAWEAVKTEYQRAWDRSLDNLVSILETGEDQRITRRPMLGISLGDFTPEQARQLSVPVTEGLRLAGVIDGMGAQQAGLQQNDVIVGMAGKPVAGYGDLPLIVSEYRAGDTVEVEYFRGPEKMRAQMVLSARPGVDIPWTAAEFASRLRASYAETDQELQAVFADLPEEQALKRADEQAWCAKDVLAHLIHVERENQIFIGDLLFSNERVTDGYGQNSPVMIAGTLAAYPTVSALLAQLFCAETETTALIANLPEELVRQKALYWRLAYNLLQFNIHTKDHIQQIRAAAGM